MSDPMSDGTGLRRHIHRPYASVCPCGVANGRPSYFGKMWIFKWAETFDSSYLDRSINYGHWLIPFGVTNTSS
jgi:hypothetical protein